MGAGAAFSGALILRFLAPLTRLRHPCRSTYKNNSKIASGDPSLNYVIRPSFKTAESQKTVVDSRSKSYSVRSLLSGGNDGIVGINTTIPLTPNRACFST